MGAQSLPDNSRAPRRATAPGNPNPKPRSKPCLTAPAKAGLLFTLSAGILGCGPTVGFPLGAVTSTSADPPGYQYLTGNWQFTTTDGNGQTFTAMAGYLYESTTGSNGAHDASSLLQAVPGSCFQGAAVIPSTGSLTGNALVLASFSVNGQDLGINLMKDATATHLTGTYKVFGGCADGDTGTITGVRYAPVNGTYKGQGTAAQELSVTLTQSTSPDGSGGSPLSGSADFAGIPCFSTGTVQTSASSVLGSSFTIQIAAADGAALLLQGTFDTAASTLTLTNASIAGDACAGIVSLKALQAD